MTEDQARALQVGEGVFWYEAYQVRGVVVWVGVNGFLVEWEDGQRNYYLFRDVAWLCSASASRLTVRRRVYESRMAEGGGGHLFSPGQGGGGGVVARSPDDGEVRDA